MTARVIMESISGYLLLGLVFSLIVTVVEAVDPAAFLKQAREEGEGER